MGGIYDGRCRHQQLDLTQPHAIRLKLYDLPNRSPNDWLNFDDLIQGHQTQNLRTQAGDQILKRRDGFYAYCMARYCFAIAQYEQAMSLLQEVEIKEQFTDLDARVLLIKTYYELDEFGLLDYSLGNFKQQLKRKKLQTYHATVYGNFAKNMSKVMHLRPYDKKAKAQLKEDITLTNAIAEKEWLLSKVK